MLALRFWWIRSVLARAVHLEREGRKVVWHALARLWGPGDSEAKVRAFTVSAPGDRG